MYTLEESTWRLILGDRTREEGRSHRRGICGRLQDVDGVRCAAVEGQSKETRNRLVERLRDAPATRFDVLPAYLPDMVIDEDWLHLRETKPNRSLGSLLQDVRTELKDRLMGFHVELQCSAICRTVSLETSYGSPREYRRGLLILRANIIDLEAQGTTISVELGLDEIDQRCVDDLLDLTGHVRLAKHRFGRLPAGFDLPVILAPAVLFPLLRNLAEAASGDSRDVSWLWKREKEEVAAKIVNIYDRPADRRSIRAAPFDDEGIPTRELVIISRGQFKGFVDTTSSGYRYGRSSTGSAYRESFDSPVVPGARLVVLEADPSAGDELERQVGTGLYIRNGYGFYSNLNIAEGSFGFVGLGTMIRSGETAERVGPFSVSGDLESLLSSITLVGRDSVCSPATFRVATPPVVCTGLRISG